MNFNKISKQRLSLLILTVFVTSSCALKTTDNNAVQNEDIVIVEDRVQTDLVEKDLPQCPSCLLGVQGDSELKAESKKVFYLHGAEHLNLENYYFDIPVVYNDATKKWIKYFTGRGRDLFKRYAERSGRYTPVFTKILSEQGLPRDLVFLAMAESGFQNHARSWAKAVGTWQFMPYTGKSYGLQIDYFKDERRDPLKATLAASSYLKKLHDEFGAWELAMAGYNAGEGKIRRAKRIYKTSSFWRMRRGRYLKRETKNYVPKIMALAIIGKNLRTFGFDNITFEETLDFHEVTVPGNSDLYKIASALGTTFEELKRYNPEIVRWQTPPGESYTMRLPVGLKEQWNKVTMSDFSAIDYKVYSMRGNASLKAVANKFKVPVKALVSINGIEANKKLFSKTKIFLPFRFDHENHQKHRLYSDLYEKPRRSVVRRRNYNRFVNKAMSRGKRITNPKEYYVVKKGDNLWNISKKLGVNINNLIKTNSKIIKRRQILPGDKLAIR